jgi:hypothetical protein
MLKRSWSLILALSALIVLVAGCGPREFQPGDVVRLVCVDPEAARGELIVNVDGGRYEIKLMTSLDLNAAEPVGTVPCDHIVRVVGVEEYGAKEYELRANVGGEVIRGWLWSLALEHIELRRIEE